MGTGDGRPLYGDANGNGKVELLDVNLMERYIAGLADGSQLHFTQADVNADGVVDNLDVEAVKEYLAGNRDSLTPVLHTLTFVTDGGGEVGPIQAGEGYPYRGEIPNPAKDGYIFVQWVKEDGSVYYVEVDGTRYTLEELELELEAIDVSESFEETLMARNQDEARTGMEQLMERYQEMLEQESDWVDLFNLSLLDQEFHLNVLAVKLNVNIIGRANVNLAVGADLEYQAGKRYTFWLHILDLKSGSSEMDLIDERFGFQFYVMGTLGFKAGVKVEVGVGLLSTSLASMGANLEFGLYLKLYGYLIYYYGKLRPAGSDVWNTTEEMLGALYLDFGIYVTAKFKARALANLFVYEPTIFDYEHSLATAGDRTSVYDFALRGSQNDVLYVQDTDLNTLNGISMPLPEIYTTMKTMDLVTGGLGQSAYDTDRFVVTFTDSRFSLDKEGNIVVDVPEGARYLRCDMRLVWKNNKLAMSKFDTDITIPVVWTNMSQSELNEKFTATVAVGNLTDGYQTVWTGRYGRVDVFDLPTQEEILELMGYYNYETDSGNLKYASVEGYQDQSTGLSLTGDKTFYFNVTPKTYTLTVRDVQDEKGQAVTSVTVDMKLGVRRHPGDRGHRVYRHRQPAPVCPLGKKAGTHRRPVHLREPASDHHLQRNSPSLHL